MLKKCNYKQTKTLEHKKNQEFNFKCTTNVNATSNRYIIIKDFLSQQRSFKFMNIYEEHNKILLLSYRIYLRP